MRPLPDDWKQIRSCALFAGLSQPEAEAALDFFDARAAQYRKGEALLRVGDPVRAFGLVLDGAVQVFADDIHGRHMIMASVSPGGVFGEALCFLRVQAAPIYILAMRPARVLWLRTEPLARPVEDAAAARLRDNYLRMLSGKLLEMNDRVQVLSKQRLRDKLVTFFTQCARRAGSRCFDIPFDRENLAAYLGVNRSALSRELARMRAEGLIEFSKNHFRVLPRP